MELIKNTDKVKVSRNRKHQKVVNQYTVVGKLGESANSKVFLVQINKNKQFVIDRKAMKSLDVNYLSRQRIAVKGMNGEIGSKTLFDGVLNEIRVSSKLSHRNLIKILEVLNYEEKGKMFIIMEYCAKGSFLSWNPTTYTFHPLWSKFELNEDIISHIFCQLVYAVYYLHHNFIVHLDLKPQNVLICQDFTLKLADFDQACCLLETEKLPKQPGTIHFFPPECLSNEFPPSINRAKAIDIWGLGLILYAAVFGVIPFNGDTLDEVFNNIGSKA